MDALYYATVWKHAKGTKHARNESRWRGGCARRKGCTHQGCSEPVAAVEDNGAVAVNLVFDTVRTRHANRTADTSRECSDNAGNAGNAGNRVGSRTSVAHARTLLTAYPEVYI